MDLKMLIIRKFHFKKGTAVILLQFFLKKWNNFFCGIYTVQDNIKSYSMPTAGLCRTYKQ